MGSLGRLLPLSYSIELILVAVVYPVLASVVLRLLKGNTKYACFAILNLILAFTFVYTSFLDHPLVAGLTRAKGFGIVLGAFAVYVLCVVADYALLVQGIKKGGRFLTAAFLAPIAELILIKYVPLPGRAFNGAGATLAGAHLSLLFVGISYLGFRLCYLVQEVQNEVVELPSLWNYLSFAFFVPTLSVGPISPYRMFASIDSPPDRTKTPILRSLSRIVAGAWKYVFLCGVLGPLTYSGLLLDGHPHSPIDLVVAIFAFTGFLYFNFSGFCDIAVGVSGLLGIEVMENFDRPFTARNFQEFWSRWHISLSSFLRDMMFTPLVKALGRTWGPARSNHAIAIGIMAVFITVGIWHGTGLNFLLFGISQGVGVAFVHYATLFTRKRLGKQGFVAYRANKLIYRLAQAATFVYFSLSLFLFANTMSDISKIFKAIVW